MMKPRFACLALAWMILAATVPWAQEQSVAPGINQNFEDPDVDRYLRMFESEGREIYSHRHEIVDALGLKPGMDVVDVGAGTGFFAMMMAERVGPGGTVYAVDIAENFVDYINKIAGEYNHDNVTGIVCTERSIELPENSVDVAFICDVYHHFEYPFDSMASIHKALRPGGTVIIVDFERVKGVSTNWILDHVRCGKGTVTDEVKDSGFDFVEEIDLMEEQYVLKFKKRDSSTDE